LNAKTVDSILQRLPRAAQILVACFLLVPSVVFSESSSNSPASTRIDYGMPERLGRQIAPSPSAPWSAPDLRGYTSLLKSAEPSPIDSQKRYNLVELIDIAERVNPETRVAWEAARQAAIGVGLVESEYFPVLTLSALGGYQSEAFPALFNVAPSGFFRANLNQVLPTLNLRKREFGVISAARLEQSGRGCLWRQGPSQTTTFGGRGERNDFQPEHASARV
jgi:hypothetical protein